MTTLFALAGRPVMHSLSPAMHNAAFAKLGIDARYVRVHAEDSAGALELCRQMKVGGFNVTAPYKEALFGRVRPQGDARHIGAVNTVLLRGGRAVGLNTDGVGALRALVENGVELKGRSALVLGAGGAGRAAVFALKSAGARVTVANRTRSRAEEVARRLGCASAGLEPARLEAIVRESEIVVSTLGAPVRVVDARALRPGTTVLDAAYGWESPLVAGARRRGLKVVDGREWLLYQGLAAFEAFTGEQAPVAVMRRALYAPGEPIRGQNLALVGFMGAGKSTVAREIARRTGMALIDIDERIEKRAGASVAELFATRGEAAFRRLERAELRRLAALEATVVACGGGAVLGRANVAALRDCMVAWLWVGPQTAVSRIEPRSRPLLKGKNPVGRAKQILEARLRAYAAASHVVIGGDERSPEAIAGLVLECFDEVSKR